MLILMTLAKSIQHISLCHRCQTDTSFYSRLGGTMDKGFAREALLILTIDGKPEQSWSMAKEAMLMLSLFMIGQGKTYSSQRDMA